MLGNCANHREASDGVGREGAPFSIPVQAAIGTHQHEG
jgi:hypothetical protein